MSDKERIEATFKTASELLQSRLEETRLSTGSPAIDSLIGGVEPGLLYLFYDENGISSDEALLRLMVNCLKPARLGGFDGNAFYLNCGNYKRSRTILDIDHLFRLMEDAGLDPKTDSKRVHAVCAFSEKQQLRAIDEVESFVEEDKEIRLIAVQQIAKLFTPAIIMPQQDAMSNFQNFTSRLKRIGYEKHLVVAASCRDSKRIDSGIPLPEGGGFFQHEANVIVHLRQVKRNQVTAFVVKHPDRGRQGLRGTFGGDELGRFTSSLRERITEAMEGLRRTYRSAFKDEELRTAFDDVWKKWDSEMAAMIYSDVATPIDLLTLTGVLENRMLINRMRKELDELKKERS